MNLFNAGRLALNRLDDGTPREIWITEGQDFTSIERKNSPYDVDIYKAIERAIEEGIIQISAGDALGVDIEAGDNITITGSGIPADPWIISGVDQTQNAAQIIAAITAQLGYSSWSDENTTLLDEDDMVSNSNTQGATQQSIVSYVQTVLANNGLLHTKQKVGKAKFHAKPDSVIYVAEVGSTIIEIAEFGDISELNMIIDREEDAINGSTYEITIRFADNTVNTWDPAAGNNPEDHDLYIPDYRIYDATLTIPLVARQEFVDASSGNASNPIVPKFQFGNGEIKFKFDNTNGPWMATNRIMIQFNFARI
jgi:hypothetical protein